jgi:hypothetical protein
LLFERIFQAKDVLSNKKRGDILYGLELQKRDMMVFSILKGRKLERKKGREDGG